MIAHLGLSHPLGRTPTPGQSSSPNRSEEVVSQDQGTLQNGNILILWAPGGTEDGLRQERGKWSMPSVVPWSPSLGLSWYHVDKLERLQWEFQAKCQSSRQVPHVTSQPFRLTPFSREQGHQEGRWRLDGAARATWPSAEEPEN